MTKKVQFLGPKMGQDGGPRAQAQPSGRCLGSSWPQDAPKMAQDGPKMAQDGLRWPQGALGKSKDGPGWPQGKAWRAQDGHKRAQDGPTMVPRWPQEKSR